MYRSLLSFVFGKASGNKTAPKAKKTRKTRCEILPLEDKIAPATITVGTFNDIAGPLPPVINATPSLRQAIDMVNYGTDLSYTVQLASGTYLLTLPGAGEDLNQSGDLDLKPQNAISVTIKGNGPSATTIDGNGLDRVLHVLASSGFLSVTLDSLTVTGGSIAGPGGGVYLADGSLGIGQTSINLTNAVISGNQVNGSGGGIAALKGDVTLSNRSSVTLNIASGVGGGIYAGSGNVSVTASGVTKNTAGDSGGGIYSGGGNTAAEINITSAVIGGATVQSNIDNNTSGGSGGGIYDANTSGLFTLNNSTVSSNLAGASGSGGGLFLADHETTITSATISNNQAGQNGGGLDHYSSGGNRISISGATVFSNNKAGEDGGALHNSGVPTLDISGTAATNVQFTNNVAGDDGGAIYDDSATTFDLNFVTLTNNKAAGDGGAIDVIADDVGVNMNSVTLTDNVSGGAGGAVNAPGGIRFGLSAGSVLRNTSVNDGGGIVAGASQVTLTSTTLNDNHTTQGSGGGLSNIGSTLLKLTTVTSSNNWAGTSGGGVNSDASTANLAAVTIDSNRAAGSSSGTGGGVNFTGSNMLIGAGATTSTITNNVATGNGGGVAALQGSSSSSLIVQDTTVSNNISSAAGGGISVLAGGSSTGGTFTLTQSVLSGNRASASGGGLRTNVLTSRVTTTTLIGNSAVTGGGGIHYASNGAISSQTLTVDSSTLNANRAGGSGSGGGVLATANSGSTTNIVNSTIDSNTAGGNGGGVATTGAVGNIVNILYGTITRNLATLGGGIHNGDASTPINLGNTIVAENTSSFVAPVPSVPGVTTPADFQAYNGMDVKGVLANLKAPDGTTIGSNLIGIENGMTGLTDHIFGNKTGTYSSPLSPQLGALASNGGPTQTRKPTATSPVLSSGYQNISMQSGALAATYDQRGLIVGVTNPRPITVTFLGIAPDIGSYEL